MGSFFSNFIKVLDFLFGGVTAKGKGRVGENRVSGYLSRLPSNEYIVLNDIMLSNGNSTSQIDHIVVSIHGVFIIETKNYTGWIFGNENSEYWTQSIYGKKYKFRNPIKQNMSHKKALEPFLREYPGIRIYSIVAFSTRCDLKINNIASSVVYIHEVPEVIKKIQAQYLTHAQMHALAEKIKSYNISEGELRAAHVSTVKEKIYKVQSDLKQSLCPRCGGNLVPRTGKYGDFYGCSSYPKCRYILKR